MLYVYTHYWSKIYILSIFNLSSLIVSFISYLYFYLSILFFKLIMLQLSIIKKFIEQWNFSCNLSTWLLRIRTCYQEYKSSKILSLSLSRFSTKFKRSYFIFILFVDQLYLLNKLYLIVNFSQFLWKIFGCRIYLYSVYFIYIFCYSHFYLTRRLHARALSRTLFIIAVCV